MGMFDSFHDAKGVEWQTKALACSLDRFYIGDEIPGPPIDYQAEVIGGQRADGGPACEWSFATIRAGRLVSAGDPRDMSLSVMEYSSGWKRPGESTFHEIEADLL